MPISIKDILAAVGSSVPVYVGTWAGRPAANSLPVNTRVNFTDVPTGMLSDWYTDGTVYRVRAPTLVARNRTLLEGTNATGEQYLGNTAMPAGMLFDGALMMWVVGWARSDATDATSATTQRIGALGTISDASCSICQNVALTSSARTAGVAHTLRVVGSTLVKEGCAGLNAFSFPGGAANSSTPFGTATGALTLSGAIYFGVSVALAAATGTTKAQVTLQELWMLP